VLVYTLAHHSRHIWHTGRGKPPVDLAKSLASLSRRSAVPGGRRSVVPAALAIPLAASQTIQRVQTPEDKIRAELQKSASQVISATTT
jgi:hypothetical protein